MLRALSLAILLVAAGPSVATEASDATVVAQQQQQTPPQAAPRRDCEKRQEGIS